MFKHSARRWVVTGALALGAAAGAGGVANAASGGTASLASPPVYIASSSSHHGGSMGNMAQVPHGPGEKLLTGSTAAKARAAALAAVPGATVIRVETDSGPAAYEAHLRKSDGSLVTVKLNRSFRVLAVQSGCGTGGPRPQGAPASGGA
jgi:hypothetical protein